MPRRMYLGAAAALLLVGACSDLGTDPVKDSDLAAPVAKIDLLDLVAEVRRSMPGRDSDGYIPPSTDEVVAFLAAVDRAIGGDVPGADAALDRYGYDCVGLVEAATGDPLVVFRERTPVRRGWGTFVWNRKADALPVDVHVNHPIHDEHSEEIGADLFRRLRGRWLLLAGTHRYANRAGDSDMARERESLFQRLFQHVAAGGRHSISVHGFAASAHPEPIASTQIILSSGKSGEGLPLAGPSAVDLRAHLQRSAVRTGLYSLDPGFEAFAGSLNPQGRFSNALLGPDRWVHVEMAQEVRRDRTRWSGLNEVIARWASTTFAEQR